MDEVELSDARVLVKHIGVSKIGGSINVSHLIGYLEWNGTESFYGENSEMTFSAQPPSSGLLGSVKQNRCNLLQSVKPEHQIIDRCMTNE